MESDPEVSRQKFKKIIKNSELKDFSIDMHVNSCPKGKNMYALRGLDFLVIY